MTEMTRNLINLTGYDNSHKLVDDPKKESTTKAKKFNYL